MALQEKYNPHNPANREQKSPAPSRKLKSFKDGDMQVIIGWILRIGVVTSMVIVFIGGVLFIFRHGHSIPDYRHFNGVPDFIRTPGGIINGILTFKGQAIIQAGIVLLIATPIIRVAFSAIGFLIEKDYLYTAITLVVLLIIVASMLGGHIG
ncbi:MAG: hypothetical protein JWP37_2582 [Mucilaginibacter sp.]|nr:hypothetical protein [Mucilaginibacter sp.]